MPRWCMPVKIGNDVGIICGSGKKPTDPPKCAFCDQQSTRLCDFVVSPPEQVTHKRTCDAPMCDEHATRIGKNRDLCPRHAKQTELFKEITT